MDCSAWIIYQNLMYDNEVAEDKEGGREEGKAETAFLLTLSLIFFSLIDRVGETLRARHCRQLRPVRRYRCAA